MADSILSPTPDARAAARSLLNPGAAYPTGKSLPFAPTPAQQLAAATTLAGNAQSAPALGATPQSAPAAAQPNDGVVEHPYLSALRSIFLRQATFGAGGPVGELRDWATGTGAVPTAPAAAPASAPAVASTPAAAASLPAPIAPTAPAPFTSADIDGTRIPVSGTGAFRNNTTGVVTNVGSPDGGGFGAVQQPARYQPAPGSLSAGVGAIMNMRHDAAVAAGQRAAAHEAPGEMKMLAEAQNEAALTHLAGIVNDPASTEAQREQARMAAATIKGHPAVADKLTAFPGLTPKDPVVFANETKGTATSVTPTTPVRAVTMSEAVADAKRNGKYKSDAQVRADVAKMANVRLTN